MTFIQKIKRFFEPLKGQTLLVGASIIKFSLWAVYALFSVHIVRQCVKLYSQNNITELKFLIGEFIIFTALYFFISYIFRRSDWPNLWHEIHRWIYRKYIREIIEMDGNSLERIGTGRIIAVISSAEKTWIDSIIHVIQEGTKMGIITTYICYLFFSQSFFLGVIFIILFIGLHFLIIYLDGFAHRYRRVRTEKKTELTRELVRITMSKNDILQSGSIEQDLEKVQSLTHEMQHANNGINSALFKIFNLVRFVSSMIRLGFIIFLVHSFSIGIIPAADVAGILALLIVFESFLFDSTQFYKNFTKDFSDIEKLWKVFDDAPKLRGYHEGASFTSKSQDIILNSITYGYNESRVFSDFSLTIEKGKKTALVGASGGGKTTLMKLIAGYLHPESGTLSVMGNILSETALKTYYPHIGYLTQDPSVFDGTIRDNLISAVSNGSSLRKASFHHEEISPSTQKKSKTRKDIPRESSSSEVLDTEELEQKLIKALHLAQCDFVFDMQHGLDTEIGERGVRLSGGQKQRLAIAKIFLKDPEIILLDEPTSALDSFSEEQITKALDELFRDRTVIVIAHRLQTVKKADEIIVIEGGKVVERGSHTSLTKEKGIYRKMLDLQSGF